MNYDVATADCYIYADILQKICIGVYVYGDILPTINELCGQYGFAATTVKKALKRLRTEELIKGETSKGTRIIFDRGNPVHITRLRGYSERLAISEFNDIEIPSTLLAGVVEAGVMHMSPDEKVRLSKQAERILQKLKVGEAFIFEAQQFLREIVAQTKNKYMTGIVDDLFRQYIVFIPPREADEAAYKSYIKLVSAYLEQLKMILLTEEYGKTKEATQTFYGSVNRIVNAFALVPANHHEAVFRKEKLYNIVMRDMVSEIISGKIKKDGFFPSTPQMCRLHGVDRRTICKAYDILEQLGLIQVIPYKGAQLVADWNDPDVRRWTRGELERQLLSVTQALEVFDAFHLDLFPLMVRHATTEMMDEMEERLHRQWTDTNHNHTLMLVTEALMTPLTSSVSSAAFHRHYDFLLGTVTDFLVLSLLQPSVAKSHRGRIYKEAETAMALLYSGNQDGFLHHFNLAVQYNKILFREVILRLTNNIEIDKNGLLI